MENYPSGFDYSGRRVHLGGGMDNDGLAGAHVLRMRHYQGPKCPITNAVLGMILG